MNDAIKLISRKTARQCGFKKYFTGEPCSKGHVAERVTESRACVICRREQRKSWISRQPPDKESQYRKRLNKSKLSTRMKKWKQENKKRHCELNRAAHMRRKARLKNAEVTHIRTGFITELLKAQENRCAACFIDVSNKYHIDHIMPIALGGDNRENNLQILCPKCNMCKNDKHPDIWRREIGLC